MWAWAPGQEGKAGQTGKLQLGQELDPSTVARQPRQRGTVCSNTSYSSIYTKQQNLLTGSQRRGLLLHQQLQRGDVPGGHQHPAPPLPGGDAVGEAGPGGGDVQGGAVVRAEEGGAGGALPAGGVLAQVARSNHLCSKS